MTAEIPHAQSVGSKRAVVSAVSAGVAVVIASIAHTFTNASIVHFRDLGHYSLPFMRWMRRTVASGHLPLWNPESGLGFSAISDPTLQLLFPPTLILRLVLPETLGLNLSVSMAIVVAFAGAMLLFARRGEIFAATAGALVFALSGPVLSAANMLNLGWSVALAPWVVLAMLRVTDLRDLSRVAVLAVVIALQLLAGEPMTFAATVAAALALATSEAPDARSAMRSVGRILPGVGLGLALSAIQLFPLATASIASARGANMLVDTWSLHPATLIETVLPGIFGTPVGPGTVSPAWYRALNGGREPLLLSVYVGIPAFAIAAAAFGEGDARRRKASFVWLAVFAVALVLAIGDYGPVLPLLREAVPGASMARFPSKFLCVGVLALSAMVCAGVRALSGHERTPASVVLACGVSAVGLVLAVVAAVVGGAGSSSATVAGWAAMLQLPQSGEVAGEFAYRLAIAGRDLALYSVLTGALVLAVRSRWFPQRLSPALLAGLVTLPLLVAGPWLCLPVMERSALSDPSWASEVDRTGRVYVSAGDGLAYSPDVHPSFRIPVNATRAAAGSIYGAAFPAYATGLGLRDAVTADLAQLRPRPYADFLGRFAAATPQERRRVLARLGVTDLVVPFEPMPPNATLLARTAELPAMAHWRISDPAPRVRLVRSVERLAGEQAQTTRFFSEWFDPSTHVILEGEAGSDDSSISPSVSFGPEATPDGASGSTGGNVTVSTATIVAESPSTLVIEADAEDSGGWLVVNDAWAPGWVATVDGVREPVERANGIVRAVWLGPGAHVVRFSYRPSAVIAGAVVSGVAGLVVVGLFVVGRFGRRRAKDGGGAP